MARALDELTQPPDRPPVELNKDPYGDSLFHEPSAFASNDEPFLRPRAAARAAAVHERIKAEDLQARGIPTYRNASGGISPITDDTGTSLTGFDARHNIAYDSKGEPKQISYDETGPPKLSDPFETLPTRTDPKTGAMEKYGPGGIYRYKGQDPVVTANLARKEKDKAIQQESTLLGRKLTLDEHDLHAGIADQKVLKNELKTAVPTLIDPKYEGADKETVMKAIDEHFNTQYAAPEANETRGWFGKDLSPEAMARRQEIDAAKAKAYESATALFDLNDQLSTLHETVSTARQQERTNVETLLAHSRGEEGPLDQPATAATPEGLTKPAQLYPPESEWARMLGGKDAVEQVHDQIRGGNVPPPVAPAVLAATHDYQDAKKKADAVKDSDPTLYEQYSNVAASILHGLTKGLADIYKGSMSDPGWGTIINPLAQHGLITSSVMSLFSDKSAKQIRAEERAKADYVTKQTETFMDERLKDSIGTKAGNFVGGIAPYVAAAFATKGTSVATPLLASMFYTSGYQSTYEDAKAHGASDEKADLAGLGVGAINAVLALPLRTVGKAAEAIFGDTAPKVIQRAITNTFEHGGPEAVGNLLGRLAEMIKGGGAGSEALRKEAVDGIHSIIAEINKTGAQRVVDVAKTAATHAALGAGVQTSENLVKKTYNPDQRTFEGVPEQALAFGTLGAASEGFRQVALARKSKQALDLIKKGTPPAEPPALGPGETRPTEPPPPGSKPSGGGETRPTEKPAKVREITPSEPATPAKAESAVRETSPTATATASRNKIEPGDAIAEGDQKFVVSRVKTVGTGETTVHMRPEGSPKATEIEMPLEVAQKRIANSELIHTKAAPSTESGKAPEAISGGSALNLGGRETATLKRLEKGVVTDPETLRNSPEGQSLATKLNGLIQRPTETPKQVNLNMVPLGRDLKIVDGVVKSIPVSMVNDLLGGELSTKEFLHNNTVFKPLTADTINLDTHKAIGSVVAGKTADVPASAGPAHPESLPTVDRLGNRKIIPAEGAPIHPPQIQEPHVVATAIRTSEGIRTGSTWNEAHEGIATRHGVEKLKPSDRGFIVQDEKGVQRFVSRTEAGPIANSASQLRGPLSAEGVQSAELQPAVSKAERKVTNLVKGTMAKHRALLTELNHEVAPRIGQTRNESGVEAKFNRSGSFLVTLDPAKLVKATSGMNDRAQSNFVQAQLHEAISALKEYRQTGLAKAAKKQEATSHEPAEPKGAITQGAPEKATPEQGDGGLVGARTTAASFVPETRGAPIRTVDDAKSSVVASKEFHSAVITALDIAHVERTIGRSGIATERDGSAVILDYPEIVKSAQTVEANGGDSQQWLRDSHGEEVKWHYPDLIVSGSRFDAIHRDIWRALSPEAQSAFDEVYPGTKSLVHKGAEYLRMVGQFREMGHITESNWMDTAKFAPFLEGKQSDALEAQLKSISLIVPTIEGAKHASKEPSTKTVGVRSEGGGLGEGAPLRQPGETPSPSKEKPAGRAGSSSLDAQTQKELSDAFEGLFAGLPKNLTDKIGSQISEGDLEELRKHNLLRLGAAPEKAVKLGGSKEVGDEASAAIVRQMREALGAGVPQLAIPAEKIGPFVTVAGKLVAQGVDTPEKLAAELETLFKGKARPFSQALWDAIGMVRPELRGTHDWTAIYEKPAPGTAAPAKLADLIEQRQALLNAEDTPTNQEQLAKLGDAISKITARSTEVAELAKRETYWQNLLKADLTDEQRDLAQRSLAFTQERLSAIQQKASPNETAIKSSTTGTPQDQRQTDVAPTPGNGRGEHETDTSADADSGAGIARTAEPTGSGKSDQGHVAELGENDVRTELAGAIQRNESALRRIGTRAVEGARAQRGLAFDSDTNEIVANHGVWLQKVNHPSITDRKGFIEAAFSEELAHAAGKHVNPEWPKPDLLALRQVAESTFDLIRDTYGREYLTKDNPYLIAMEYGRMLAMVRGGKALPESFYQETSELEAELAKPQPPEAEANVAKVLDVLGWRQAAGELPVAPTSEAVSDTIEEGEPPTIADIGGPKFVKALKRKFTPGLDITTDIKEGIQSLLLPSAQSSAHLRAAELLGSKLGPMHRRQEASRATLKKDWLAFERLGVHREDVPLTKNRGIQFMSDISQAKIIDPKLKPIADRMQGMFTGRVALLEKAGAPLETVREHYFPGMWTRESREAFNAAVEQAIAAGIIGEDFNPNDATAEQQAWIKERADKLVEEGAGSEKDAISYLTRRPLKGRESFRKQKVFDDIMTGVKFGLRPISNNPVDLVMLKLAEMDKSVMANEVFQELRGGKQLKTITPYEKVPDGWAKVQDKYGTIYGPPSMRESDTPTNMMETKGASQYIGLPILGYRIVPEPVADILNNFLSSSLYNNRYFGTLFTGWMGVANALNQTQLGVGSAFHAGFTTMEAQISGGANLVKDVYGLLRGNRSLTDLLKTTKNLATASVETGLTGDKILNAWRNPDGVIDPRIAQVVRAAELAGAGFKLETGLQTDQASKFVSDWLNGHRLRAARRSPVAFVEMLAKPIMEWIVPRQKAGVFAHLVWRIIEQNPNKSMEALTLEFRQAWNRVDARLGQVRYDRLFINNTAKNVVQGLVRAPGWSGGTIAELGGAFKDGYKFFEHFVKTGKLPADIPDRVAYTIALLVTVMVVNAALTALFTGDKPEGLDYFAFRTGGKDEHGNPERFILPTYVKDLIAYVKEPWTTLINKSHPLLSVFGDLFRNKDYYGVEIRDQDSNALMQAIQGGGYVAKSFTPFWIRGTQKEVKQGGMTAKALLPLIGVMPAPRKMTQTPAQALADEINKGSLPAAPLTERQAERRLEKSDMASKIRRGEAPDISGALARGTIKPTDVKAIYQRARQAPIAAQVDHMSLENAERVYQRASLKERAVLAPIMARKRATAAKRGRTMFSGF